MMKEFPELVEKANAAKEASRTTAVLSTEAKNRALGAIAAILAENKESVFAENRKDVAAARESGMKESLVDRLELDEKKMRGIVDGVHAIMALPDPVGRSDAAWVRPNGLRIMQVRVPFGLVGIIYESRPNVTVDTFALALKSGNAILLRGSRSAINTNKELVRLMKAGLASTDVPENAVALVESMDREAVDAMLKMKETIDLVIPRGGQGLINMVVQKCTIPVIETGVGNCHIFVDASADLEAAKRIIVNAKCQRPGVCNAMETLLVHKSLAETFLPEIIRLLQERGVEVRGCERTRRIAPEVKEATEQDWATEYLDLILAVKIVENVAEAIAHITRFSSGHSEAILSNDYANICRFTSEVDAAAVYVNASTRFTDGGEFGFGAEMGISTQKLHVRGPVGLKELTTSKYVIYGEGQVRQ
ncbi:glutamate-5-semialdehyde dehydrogenase [bacterium]|nr:glutamate-5-semialdehyde dehydrogenase [bacterium]